MLYSHLITAERKTTTIRTSEKASYHPSASAVSADEVFVSDHSRKKNNNNPPGISSVPDPILPSF
jgi:hypothetical protein